MAQEFSKAFYNSKAWKECRKAYIASVNGICESKGCYNAIYIVHHKIELTPFNINDPDITLNFNNLEGKCLKCHNAIHKPSDVIDKNLMFTADGDIVSR